MKLRESELRSKRFEAEDKARKVADIEAMIREFELMAADLGRQIGSEEERTGIRDNKHFAYSTFAEAAGRRRENLINSIEDLRGKLAEALHERDLAIEDLRKIEQSDGRENNRTRYRNEQISGLIAR